MPAQRQSQRQTADPATDHRHPQLAVGHVALPIQIASPGIAAVARQSGVITAMSISTNWRWIRHLFSVRQPGYSDARPVIGRWSESDVNMTGNEWRSDPRMAEFGRSHHHCGEG
ncbi:hypothetical protein GCM10010464_07760 [Pseudonocardia yunnanensis]